LIELSAAFSWLRSPFLQFLIWFGIKFGDWLVSIFRYEYLFLSYL
jgi:hypothetical protein